MGELTNDGALAGIRDHEIVAMLADAGVERAYLCRELALRDPDRDPEYALRCFRTGDGPLGRWLGRQVYRSPWVWMYGITRLRRARPIEHISPDVTHWSATRRYIAVRALGDTADYAAVPFVKQALNDPVSWVRAEAEFALRQLAEDGVILRSDRPPVP